MNLFNYTISINSEFAFRLLAEIIQYPETISRRDGNTGQSGDDDNDDGIPDETELYKASALLLENGRVDFPESGGIYDGCFCR